MKTLLTFLTFFLTLGISALPTQASYQSIEVTAVVLPNISYQRSGDNVTISSNATDIICIFVDGRYLETVGSEKNTTISSVSKLVIVSNF